MTLPAPHLDDRRFQDLVDEAKRMVQQRCPEWTDHNVSDPGVTLIETFAFMVDQLLYRLNRVPDRLYVKFLELIGVRLLPPTAARVPVTFWLSAAQPGIVRVPSATEVATVRTESEKAVAFTVTERLDIVPCSLARVASSLGPRTVRDHTERFRLGEAFHAFSVSPKPGDALLVGLSEAVPSCVVLLRFDCEIEGVGVDPRRPPLVWEAWAGEGWVPCEVERDETGGLNRAGDVIVHVPATHQARVIANHRCGWLRCRVVEAEEGQPRYSASPEVRALEASTIGGTAPAVNAEIVVGELLGASTGVPGQRFALQHRPVVPSDSAPVLEVAGSGGWGEWTVVETFAESGPADRHFLLEETQGEVVLGPAVRELDGSLRRYGAVPPAGAMLRLRAYHTGGGRHGNVARGAVSVLKSSIPYISRIENRRAATGGVDGEDIEGAKIRGPLLLRARDRAVTREDYEQLAREAAPEAARIHCVAITEGADAGTVRVLVVPHVREEPGGQLRHEQLIPSEDLLERITRHLDERRVIGARVVVEPPVFQGFTAVARLRGRHGAAEERLQDLATEALYSYFNPLRGGPDGTGWPFGRPVQVGEVYAVLQRIPAAAFVEEVRLFPADPVRGRRGEPTNTINIDPAALILSYRHQVLMEPAR
ncbi:MAG: putative baseplate assembly protein [Actinomycetota bacterium]